jgi:hypothetical protein
MWRVVEGDTICTQMTVGASLQHVAVVVADVAVHVYEVPYGTEEMLFFAST